MRVVIGLLNRSYLAVAAPQNTSCQILAEASVHYHSYRTFPFRPAIACIACRHCLPRLPPFIHPNSPAPRPDRLLRAPASHRGSPSPAPSDSPPHRGWVHRSRIEAGYTKRVPNAPDNGQVDADQLTPQSTTTVGAVS